MVTNGDADVQAGKVDRLGITPLLDACFISGAIGVRKPDARIFQIAAARCDTPLSNAWMIGDGEPTSSARTASTSTASGYTAPERGDARTCGPTTSPTTSSRGYRLLTSRP